MRALWQAVRVVTVLVAMNPAASFGRNAAVGPRVVAALRAAGHRVTAFEESSAVLVEQALRRALRDRVVDAVVAVGGDGMVHLVGNVIAGTEVPLGIVPTGTGNDIARSLGVPHDDPDLAVDALLGALGRPARRIDLVRLEHEQGTRVMLGVLSAGFDALANERGNHLRWPRGRSRYVLAVLIEVVRLRPFAYRLVLDGEVTNTRAVLVNVGNGSSVGGGMRLTPDARMDDGLLDVLVATPVGRLALLRVFPRVFRGTHVTHPAVTIRRAREVRIEGDAPVVYADGERIGALPVHLTCLPGALTVLA